jgi:hypothetical protein
VSSKVIDFGSNTFIVHYDAISQFKRAQKTILSYHFFLKKKKTKTHLKISIAALTFSRKIIANGKRERWFYVI